MRVHTLQAGDEVLLDGVLVTVLAVEDDTVWLGVTVVEDGRGVAQEAAGGLAVVRAALTAVPSKN
jgi:hypothetical protein